MKAILFSYALQALTPDGNVYVLDSQMSIIDCIQRSITVKRENEFLINSHTKISAEGVKFSCIIENR